MLYAHLLGLLAMNETGKKGEKGQLLGLNEERTRKEEFSSFSKKSEEKERRMHYVECMYLYGNKT